MNLPPGFDPTKFHLAGKMLLIIGVLGLVLVGASNLTGWFAPPQIVLPVSVVAIPLSLFFIFLVPGEK